MEFKESRKWKKKLKKKESLRTKEEEGRETETEIIVNRTKVGERKVMKNTLESLLVGKN